MKKIPSIVLVCIIAASVCILSCRREECVPSSKGEIQALTAQWLANSTQTFEVNAASPPLLIGQKGTRIRFAPNSFRDAAGNAVVGTVKVELVELYDKATMAMLNKPTLAKRGYSFVPLVSAGSFFIQATQNGKPLTLAVPAVVSTKTDQIDSEMSKFNGVPDSVGQVIWQLAPDSTLTPRLDSATVAPMDTARQFWYSFPFDASYSWVNCDQFMYLPGAPTDVKLNLPDGYTVENTKVYLSLDGWNSILNMFPYVEGGFFIGAYYTLPQGSKVTFVVIAYRDKQLEYAIQPATLMANHEESITQLKATNEKDLKKELSKLP
jgi:hypothetical protein